MRKLTLDDIKDMRAYEREREEFRSRVIAMKRRRRIQLGELMTIVFENTDTMRFQIQEMARIERLISDEAIEGELRTYNELIPDAGELSGTLFIELTTDELLREWLPRLVGIQRHLALVLADGSVVRAEPIDEERLTRDEITSTVHYLRFRLSRDQAAAFGAPEVRLVVDHPEYTADVVLDDDQRLELAADLLD